MVEVSNLYDLDIYTIAGQYVGQVADVVLNIKYGTISKLQVKALEPEKKNIGFRDMFRSGFQFVPEDESVRTYQEGLLSVDYDKVKAVGDIMLIDPQDMRRPQAQRPAQGKAQAKPSVRPNPEAQPRPKAVPRAAEPKIRPKPEAPEMREMKKE